MKFYEIDFEFNQTAEEKVNIVCAVVRNIENEQIGRFWLHKSDSAKSSFKKWLESKKGTDAIFLAHGASAEARCFYSLGLDPTEFNWVDNFIEYRNLSNHNDRINFGKQYVDGKVKMTFKPKPKWERTEEDSKTGFKPKHNYAETAYKLLGERVDSQRKTKMRDIIIAGDEDEIEEHKEEILDYCLDDILRLYRVFEKIWGEMQRGGFDLSYEEYLGQALERGKYAALTGIRESFGHPINEENLKNFAANVPSILDDKRREINRLFPEIGAFRWNPREQRFSWRQKRTREWLEENVDIDTWKKTDSGKLSLKLEAWTKIFDFKHSYPKDNFGAQIVEYLKMKQAFNGFTPSPSKKSFWDCVGSDGRARPYMNIFGSQSSRTQPPSTTYLLLKPAWTRSQLQPPKGKCITSIDYKSEEFFITALYYRDKAMIDAYLSGDVYLGFGKQAGVVPQDATKKTHKKERDPLKSTVLGISYLMTKYGLSNKLTNDTGETYTEEDAQEYINMFYEAFDDMAEGQQDFIRDYYDREFWRSYTGWCMWSLNENHRSVGNVPIQTLGAEIMREADIRCWERGVYACATLHDALYIEHDVGDYEKIDIAMEEMKKAFTRFFPGQEKIAEQVGLDPFTWGPDLKQGQIQTPRGEFIDCDEIYIDERATEQYEKYKEFFESSNIDCL